MDLYPAPLVGQSHNTVAHDHSKMVANVMFYVFVLRKYILELFSKLPAILVFSSKIVVLIEMC